MLALGRRLVVVAAISLFVPGCMLGPCGLVSADDGLVLEVEVTGGSLPPGDYTVVARIDGIELRLAETLEGGGALVMETPEAAVGDHHAFLEGVVFEDTGMLTVGFREGGGPANVTIEVWRGDAMLVQESYAPKYSEFRPNGDHCAPAVDRARDRLVIEAPTA